jgi:cobalt/nickel transport system permease protein
MPRELVDMTRRGYSSHVPDFRYVTYFAQTGSSIVHRMNPWTKLGLLFFVVALVTVVLDIWPMLVLLGLALLVYIFARLPLRVLIGWWSLPVLFVVSLSILYVFTEPGTVVAGLKLGGFRIGVTDSGLLLMATLLVKALAVVTFSLTIFMTTRYNHIVHIAYRALPKTLATVFLLSYRFMFETADEFSDILDAMHSRSGGLAKGVGRQSRTFAGIFGLGFVHAFERAEAISKAMEARGFTGDLPVTDGFAKPTYGGYVLMGVATVALALAVYSRYFNGELIGWW